METVLENNRNVRFPPLQAAGVHKRGISLIMPAQVWHGGNETHRAIRSRAGLTLICSCS